MGWHVFDMCGLSSAWPSVSIQWQPIQRTWYIGGGGPGREYGAPHQWRRYVCYLTLGSGFTGVSCGSRSSFPDRVLFERRGFQSWCSVAKTASLISVCVHFTLIHLCFTSCFLVLSCFSQSGRGREKLFQSACVIFWYNDTFLVFLCLLSAKSKLINSLSLNISTNIYLPFSGLYFDMNLKDVPSKGFKTTENVCTPHSETSEQ